MKKRTAFETVLVRRVAKKNDYLRYAAYEMGLETLRKKRAERLSTYLFIPCGRAFLTFFTCRTASHKSVRLGLRSRTKTVPHIRACT